MLSSMFKKTYTLVKETTRDNSAAETDIPAGLWRKCNSCGRPLYTEDVKNHFYICPKCGGYFRVHAYRRIEMLADTGSFEEWDETLVGDNPLDFPGYEEKLDTARERSGLREAVVTGKLAIEGHPAAVAVMDSRFMMASMGYAVGEKITRMVERATAEGLPVIIYTASGGARMQEGIVSLMQMAKTSAALKAHSEAGRLYITVLTNPTTGGVTASFAMLGDIILAEPGALIGFAGPRVIEQTIGQKLPEGFQTAEFLLEHGFVDRIVPREQQREELAALLAAHERQEASQGEESAADAIVPEAASGKGAATALGSNAAAAVRKVFPGKGREDAVQTEKALSAWEKVQLSRSPKRPVAQDYIEVLFEDFMELHGDRQYRDDGAVIGGIAWLGNQPVTVVGIQKGRSVKENVIRNFGMPHPEGYRKALRLMKQAEKFGRPIICLIDTAGAYPGKEAEERGQGEAIARNLYEMSALRVPVLSMLIGEGGSGGALALCVANQVWMLEHAIYSILSPEGFASILYKDASKAAQAAERMRITAGELAELGIIDKVIHEPETYTRKTLEQMRDVLRADMAAFLADYQEKSGEEVRRERVERYRRY